MTTMHDGFIFSNFIAASLLLFIYYVESIHGADNDLYWH